MSRMFDSDFSCMQGLMEGLEDGVDISWLSVHFGFAGLR
jgi:hypothetical protein